MARTWSVFLSLLIALGAAGARAQQTNGSAAPTDITVDAHAPGTPFPHFWEEMFGSGRANLSLRDDYRKDLRLVKKVTDFQYVRFHGIFDDENGVYSEDAHGNPVYNWSYVDQIYDGLLANGIRPFVEISFMPKALAAKVQYHAFWYKPIPAPPANYAKWDALITAFAQHLIDRYGLDEVSQWYFEVWNEPNIDFWIGRPAQSTYFELYDHTARAVKAANVRLRVGGPATAQAAWVGDLIAHTEQNHVPLDFVSTHVYGNDSAENVFHDNRHIAPHQMVCAAVDKVHDEIIHSARPQIPLIWSEFNATYANEQALTDSIYMGPWMADTISKCDGKTQMMSYWSFSDVFEEQGVVRTPFYGGYGLVAEDDVPKPAYDDFMLLHELGDERLPAPVDEALVTRRADGALVIAAWNLVEPGAEGSNKTVTFDFKGVADGTVARIRRVDSDHGDTLDAWKKMGSPKNLTQAEMATLRTDAELHAPEDASIQDHQLTVTLPPMGLAVIEIPWR
ncbi:MAG TPA: glycosyl hydrolase family 39 [Acidobacteriaceae bacterium]|jgi:xylan 1,4-beta-xylosidase|nr:glycosyl hydrolase family 39 [Acidobacteriaceae bacterium]